MNTSSLCAQRTATNFPRKGFNGPVPCAHMVRAVCICGHDSPSGAPLKVAAVPMVKAERGLLQTASEMSDPRWPERSMYQDGGERGPRNGPSKRRNPASRAFTKTRPDADGMAPYGRGFTCSRLRLGVGEYLPQTSEIHHRAAL